MARRYADTMLYWRGHLRAKEVQNYLGVSERTARSLIAGWRRVDGILPRYRPGAGKHLVPAEGFDPEPAVTDPNVALSLLLMADRSPGNPFAPVAPPGGGHDLTLLARVPSPGIRQLIGASLERRPVWLLYAAKSGRQEFVFHPSALVRSRGRYHVRGYRANGQDVTGRRLDDRYVDVVPGRSIESSRVDETAFIGLEGDTDWQTFETRRFTLAPELASEERLCYEHEYGIAESGVLEVTDRRALMAYVAQELSERRCWRPNHESVPIWREAVTSGGTPGSYERQRADIDPPAAGPRPPGRRAR